MAENFANNYSTAIDEAGDIDNSQTTFDVLSVGGAPATNFRIKVENEYMLVTDVTGNTFTVERGAEGSTAAAHVDGTLVTHVITAAAMTNATPGDWTPYTPALTATTTNPTLGSSTLTGRYKLLDSKTCVAVIQLGVTTGGAWNAGSGEWKFSLPLSAASVTDNVGSALVLDSGTAWFSGTSLRQAANSLLHPIVIGDASGSRILANAVPVTWATGDAVRIQIVYEVA